MALNLMRTWLEVAKGSDSPAEIRGEEERKAVSPTVGPGSWNPGQEGESAHPLYSNSFHTQVFLK